MALSPAKMAVIHGLSFPGPSPRPWRAEEIAEIASRQGAIDLRADQGFLLGRVIADEAELLTLAVHPDARRGGVARALVTDFLIQARHKGATTAFLEVAANNRAARNLYLSQGFAEAGTRPAYYAGIDATIMRYALSPPPA